MSGRFCNMPFNSLEMSPDGTCQVCCKIEKVILKDDGSKFNLVVDQLDDMWNSEDLTKLRHQFLKGEEPSECRKCWFEESTGNYSLRQQTIHSKINLDNPVPTYVSLKLSNKCNLACRICSPHLSSLWEAAFRKSEIPLDDAGYFLHVKDDKLTNKNAEVFQNWAPSFEHVLLYGGEPLINNEVINFLTFCSESGISKNIEIILNTNGTIFTDSIIEKLSRFKKVILYLSIDDIGPRFEYQRWPAKWDRISENIKKFSRLPPPFDVRLYPTFSILNTLHIKEILDGLSQFNLIMNITNIIHEPDHLAVKSASRNLKIKMVEAVQSVNFSDYFLEGEMNYKSIFVNNILAPAPQSFPTQKHWYKVFSSILYKSDVDRDQDFKTFFPEMDEILSREFAE